MKRILLAVLICGNLLISLFLVNISSTFAAEQVDEKAESSLIEEARIFGLKGLVKEAENAYLEALNLPDQRELALQELIKLYQEVGAFVETEELCRKFLKQNPFHYFARLGLARAYLSGQKFKEAIAEVLRMNRLKQESPEGSFVMAVAYYELGEESSYERVINSCLGRNPMFFEARIHRAKYFLKAGKTKSAREDASFLLQQNENNWDAILVLAKSYAKEKNLVKAKAELSRFSVLHNGRSKYAEEIAETYKELGDLRAAKDFLYECLGQRKAKDGEIVRIAKILIQIGDYSRAETELKKAIELEPSHDPSVYLLVKLYLEEKNYELAGKILKDYNERFPTKSWSAVAYAKVLQLIDKFEPAEQVLVRSTVGSKYDEDVILELARVKAKQKKFKESLQYLATAESTYPESADIKLFYSQVLTAVGSVSLAETKQKEAKGLLKRSPATIRKKVSGEL